jgi:hypothetical protein
VEASEAASLRAALSAAGDLLPPQAWATANTMPKKAILALRAMEGIAQSYRRRCSRIFAATSAGLSRAIM